MNIPEEARLEVAIILWAEVYGAYRSDWKRVTEEGKKLWLAKANKLLQSIIPIIEKQTRKDGRERIFYVIRDYFNLSFGEFSAKYSVIKGKYPGDEIFEALVEQGELPQQEQEGKG